MRWWADIGLFVKEMEAVGNDLLALQPFPIRPGNGKYLTYRLRNDSPLIVWLRVPMRCPKRKHFNMRIKRMKSLLLSERGQKCVVIAGILAVSLAVAGCGKGKGAGGPPGGPEVAVVVVKPERVTITTELPGRASASLVAEVRPQVNGLIQKRLFTEGSDVVAGQDLYQIDPAPFQAALDNAEAALGRAEASLPALRSRMERVKQALVDKAVSQQDFDDAEAALNQAEADARVWRATVKTARINLGYARIVSPISGRIGKSTVTDGAIVTAYQPVPLATIQQLDPIYVDVPQSTATLRPSQKEGGDMDKVQLILGDGSAYPHEGTLQFRDISVDQTTGSVILRMVFPNPEGILLPGMFVRTVVKESVNEQAILVPQQAVSRNPKGDPLALIVDASGKVEQKPLKLDRAVGNRWLVASGLQAGDKVVVEGAQKVRPGVEVRTVPFEAPAAN